MCDKCLELDAKVERYRAIRSRITDRFAVQGLTELIAEAQAKQAELHRATEPASS
jgi:hypothetical protein